MLCTDINVENADTFILYQTGFFKIHFLRSTQKQALSKTDFKMHDYACNNYTRQSLNLDGPIKCQVVIFKVLSASKSLRDFSAN